MPTPDAGRTVLIYRILVGVLVAALIFVVFFPRRETETQPELEVIDIGAYVDAAVREHPDWPDIVSSAYYRTSGASVHVHVMGPRQICPLHLHETTDEATVVVSGTADVSFAFGRDGVRTSDRGRFAEGSVIYSPKYCGHEWSNGGDAPLANLVFTAPRFTGNRYVRSDEAMLLRGAAPTIVLPEDSATVPIAGGTMRVLSLDAPEPLAAVGAATIVYVTGGTGSLEAQRTVALAPRRLVVQRARHETTLRPTAGERLRVVVFQPPAGEDI